MPEGDTVFQLSQRLQPLTGRRITVWDARTPSLATTDAAGMRIERVWPWGKHLYWELSSPSGSDVLHTHLGMDGNWRLHPAGTPWRAPGHTARLVVRVEGSPEPANQVEVVGHDLPVVELWPAAQYERRTAHLGPDPLGPDWEAPGRWSVPGRDEAVRRLAAARDVTIGEAVLDQRVVAGLGNVFRAELCFLLGVHPASHVRCRDPEAVVGLAGSLLQANRDTRIRVFTGVERRGENTYVYGRQRQPCRRCGTLIRHGEMHTATGIADPRAGRERMIYWCPHCQPLETLRA